MQAPDRAELHAALNAIRQAAERLRNYDATLADQLVAAIEANIESVNKASGFLPDADVRKARIVAQCHIVMEAVARAKQYPEQIQGRAAVLDRAGGLARLIREALPQLETP